MKVFYIHYRWHGRFQTDDSRDFVVVAERADKAIGMVVQQESRVKADLEFWTWEEVDITQENIYYGLQACT